MKLLNRIISAVIDMILSGFITVILALLLKFIDIEHTTFIPVILFSFAYTLFICKDLIYSGRSLGKYIMKLDILNKYNNTPSIITLILRNTFIFIWPLGFLVCIINPEKKIEDILLGTKVVSNIQKREKI